MDAVGRLIAGRSASQASALEQVERCNERVSRNGGHVRRTRYRAGVQGARGSTCDAGESLVVLAYVNDERCHLIMPWCSVLELE